jgi:hypothetical protein
VVVTLKMHVHLAVEKVLELASLVARKPHAHDVPRARGDLAHGVEIFFTGRKHHEPTTRWLDNLLTLLINECKETTRELDAIV